MNRSNHKWLAFTALIPAMALVFLDQTILPVALPVIQREFNASNVALQWAVNAYILAIAIFVLAAGKLGDRIGHRRALLLGLTLFTGSSALCGFSPNIGWLIAARAFQGVGAALMFPAQSALLAEIFAPHERGRASGFNISISSIFLIIGPLIGGYLTQTLSWRWIFWINLPIAAFGFFWARAFLPASPGRLEKIDLWGFFLFACGSGALITAFMEAREWGWTSPITLLCFFAAFLLLGVLLKRKVPHPFLDLSLFRHPVYAAICISVSVIQFILMITVFRAIYFQTVLDYTPTETGLLTFVSCVPVLFCSPIGGYLSDRISPKLPIGLGFLFLIYSFLWLAIFSVPSLVGLIAAITAFGIGIPLIFTPSYSSAMGVVPPSKLGIAFGLLSTLRNFSAAMGVALIGLLSEAVQDNRFLSYAADLPETAQLPKNELLQYSRGISRNHQELLEGIYRQSEIDAFSASHYVLAFVLVAAFAAFFLLYHRKSGHHPPESFAEGWD